MINLVPIPIEEFEGRQQKRASAGFVDTNTLMATQFPAILWVVPGYVPEGLSILAGRQKLGKTWLALDWALAVACGGMAMGLIGCDQGNVLYIDLENGPRRIQGRINTLFPSAAQRPDLSRLLWAHDAPGLDKGLLRYLDDWIADADDPRMVIIDVLQRVKPTGKARQNAYESDYEALAGLQRWATDRRVAVVCLHHTRKGGADDPLEALSGSNGLSACADTTLLLDRKSNGTTLYVRGRDVEEKETAVEFAGGIWNAVGDASIVRRSAERSRILAAVENSTEPMSPSDIADATGMKNANVRRLLHSMAMAGEVKKHGHGRYSSPNSAVWAGNNGNTGNIGKLGNDVTLVKEGDARLPGPVPG